MNSNIFCVEIFFKIFVSHLYTHFISCLFYQLLSTYLNRNSEISIADNRRRVDRISQNRYGTRRTNQIDNGSEVITGRICI